MNANLYSKSTAPTLDIDLALWDSYLLVSQLYAGARPFDSQRVQTLCVEQVEALRTQLQDAGLGQTSIERISHAQCALLDEAVLSHGQDRGRWEGEPLQVRFFGQHQAGESLFEQIREALAAPAPDLTELTVYLRILRLGFKGRYPALDDPQRLQLLASLEQRVGPVQVPSLATSARARQGLVWRDRAQQLPVQMMMAAVLLGALWLTLDRWLSGVVARLLPGQG